MDTVSQAERQLEASDPSYAGRKRPQRARRPTSKVLDMTDSPRRKGSEESSDTSVYENLDSEHEYAHRNKRGQQYTRAGSAAFEGELGGDVLRRKRKTMTQVKQASRGLHLPAQGAPVPLETVPAFLELSTTNEPFTDLLQVDAPTNASDFYAAQIAAAAAAYQQGRPFTLPQSDPLPLFQTDQLFIGLNFRQRPRKLRRPRRSPC